MFEFLTRHAQRICVQLTSPQTSPVFTALLLEPFLKPQMYMNAVFLIFLLVSLVVLSEKTWQTVDQTQLINEVKLVVV